LLEECEDTNERRSSVALLVWFGVTSSGQELAAKSKRRSALCKRRGDCAIKQWATTLNRSLEELIEDVFLLEAGSASLVEVYPFSIPE